MNTQKKTRRWGFTLTELLIVLTIVAVMMTLGLTRFERGLEQSRADIAAANLRAIWSAQRLYWLEHRHYAASFTELASLLDPAVTLASTPYTYSLAEASGTTFTATATRVASKWTGSLVLDQTGAVSGSLHAAGQHSISPGFQ